MADGGVNCPTDWAVGVPFEVRSKRRSPRDTRALVDARESGWQSKPIRQ
jgi:hypothetical protein